MRGKKSSAFCSLQEMYETGVRDRAAVLRCGSPTYFIHDYLRQLSSITNLQHLLNDDHTIEAPVASFRILAVSSISSMKVDCPFVRSSAEPICHERPLAGDHQ